MTRLNFLIIFGMLLILGCSSEPWIKEINHTIYLNKTILVVNNVTNNIIKEVVVYRNITKVEYINYTRPDVECRRELGTCNVLRQNMFREYQDCLKANTSSQVSNITGILYNLQRQYDNCTSVIRNITRVLRR